MTVRSFTTAAALAVVALSSATAQTAAPAPSARTATPTPTPAPQRATVVRDTATGKLRAPTAEEAAELAATPAPSSARSAVRVRSSSASAVESMNRIAARSSRTTAPGAYSFSTAVR